MLIRPQISATAAQLGERLAQLRGLLAAAAARAGRSVDAVTLLAVSKGHAAEDVAALATLGQRAFGESYLQEALPKMDALAGLSLEWHYIGRLQANKTRPLAERFHWVHALDRLRIAERLSQQRPLHSAPLNVCVQVKPGDDPAKGGLSPDEAEQLALQVARLPRLALRGCMCMLPEGLTAAQQLQQFGQVAALQARLVAGGLPLDTLSMGMSGDFGAAIAAGSTLVRVGTALFGPRPDATHDPNA
jgi:pyridoxal phosphate enzyme (YggS family)